LYAQLTRLTAHHLDTPSILRDSVFLPDILFRLGLVYSYSVLGGVHNVGTAIQLNGFTVWGFIIEVGRGLRLRLSVGDWERLGLNSGQRIRATLPNRLDARLIVAELVEAPPVVWVMLTHRVCEVRSMQTIGPGQVRKQATPTPTAMGAARRSSGRRESSRGNYIMCSFPRVVERLHSLVLRDQRYPKLGIRGLIRVAFDEVAQRVPTADEISEVVRDFWEFWHEKYDRPQHQREVWASSRQRTREDQDLSPRQENAIRAWEDG